MDEHFTGAAAITVSTHSAARRTPPDIAAKPVTPLTNKPSETLTHAFTNAPTVPYSPNSPDAPDVPNVPDEPNVPTDEHTAVARHRHPVVKRERRLLSMLLWGGAGMIVGAAVLALPQRGDLSMITAAGTDSSFLSLMLERLIQTGLLLLAAYVTGYFALGNYVAWLVPFVSGLGAGLTAAYLITEDVQSALLLSPSVVGAVVLCSFAANASGELSDLLLKMVTGSKNSIVITGCTSRAYTLRYAAYLAILLLLSIYEAVIKML